MSVVAARARVGVGTLYRRYPSRDALVVQVCLDGMGLVEAAARAALVRAETAPWDRFCEFLSEALAVGAGSFLPLGGTFTPPADLLVASDRVRDALGELLDQAQTAGAVRDDVTVADIELVLEQLQTVRVADPEKVAALQQRYLTLALQGLRPGGLTLPGPPPTWDDIRRRWTS